MEFQVIYINQVNIILLGNIGIIDIDWGFIILLNVETNWQDLDHCDNKVNGSRSRIRTLCHHYLSGLAYSYAT